MRKQRAADIPDIPLPRRAQSKLIQSAGRSSKSSSSVLFQQKLLPPGPPRSSANSNGNSRASQFCLSSSSMGVRRLPSRVALISKGRFGKRQPTFTTEYVGPAIDSEDSGFGCDFHSSETQLSWCNEDSATNNNNTSRQQPLFTLSSRTLSNSNLSTSSQISVSSSSSSSSPSYTVPQFSTSSPEKQFLASLLHEAQEDAIDPFDGPYFSVTATPTPSSPSNSISVCDSNPSSSILLAPESTVQTQQILYIVPPEAPSTRTVGGSSSTNADKPLDFAQVFGKLSSTASASTTTAKTIVNSAIGNDYFQKRAGITQSISTEQLEQKSVDQQRQLSCDRNLIKIEPHQESNSSESMKLPEIINNDENICNSKFSSFALAEYPLSKDGGEYFNAVNNITIAKDAPASAPDCSLSKLRDILIESSREASALDGSDSYGGPQTNASGGRDEDLVVEATTVDPMVILSQAVSLQKELYEEPALDGIPITGKAATISGFGFAKGITTTATSNPSLKGLLVDSLPTTSLPTATTIVSVVPQQTQQVIDPQQTLKLMQLTENVRMSPDSTDPGVTVSSTLPFSTHQVTRSIAGTPATTPMGVNPTSPTSTTATTPSGIPMKRSRFSFPHPAAKGTGLKLRNQNHNQNYMPVRSAGKRLPPGTTPTLTSNLAPYCRDGRVQLQIVAQPEEQHRARYQTEGSRGAIKDRKGNGFPTVKLVGYDKPATLQIFIGTDQGKVSPHMFYQACKVTGKSSTPCIEKKVEGTILIEIEFEPSKEMVISCDCVGILKERNVDVEQRFPFHHASQSRKKSTKCRMIFRTTVINSDGIEETLQVASLPILCTQPPGVPEICKQSLSECPAKGGLELFVIGKNFLKDTRVVFQQEDGDGRAVWEASSEPLKDYLQQNHLICVVPPFKEEKVAEPVECKFLVVSGGKHSEPHRFTYLPELANAHLGIPPALSSCVPSSQNQSPQQQASPPINPSTLVQQIQNGQGLLPMDLQNVSVMQPRENGLVKTVIVSSSNEGCSPVSIASAESSMCSSSSLDSQLGQQSPPVTTTTMNPLTTLGFTSAPLIQTTTTAETQAVSTFQAALQQAVQQQQQQIQNQQQQLQNQQQQLLQNQQQQQLQNQQQQQLQNQQQQQLQNQQQQQLQNQQQQQLQNQQQVENKTMVGLMKSELLESLKPSVSQVFPPMDVQEQKPVVTNSIPLDLQFPPQDLSAVTTCPPQVPLTNTPGSTVQAAQLNNFAVQEPSAITTMNELFQSTESQINCVSIPQIMNGVNGIGLSNSLCTTATSPPVMAATVTVSNPSQTQNPTTTGNEVVITTGNSATQITVSSLTVADCLGQAIIKTEAVPQMNNDLRLTMSNNAVTVAPPLQANTPGSQVMGLMDQGSIASALSQMSDNELINYINPTCFEGPLL